MTVVRDSGVTFALVALYAMLISRISLVHIAVIWGGRNQYPSGSQLTHHKHVDIPVTVTVIWFIVFRN